MWTVEWVTHCILFSLLFFVVGVLVISHIKLWIEFRGLQNSTHQVQLVDSASYFQNQGGAQQDDRELPPATPMSDHEKAAAGFFDDLEERLN